MSDAAAFETLASDGELATLPPPVSGDQFDDDDDDVDDASSTAATVSDVEEMDAVETTTDKAAAAVPTPESGGGGVTTLDQVLGAIKPPVQTPYTNTILFKERKYKVFPSDGARLYCVVHGNEIVAVVDNRLKELQKKNGANTRAKIAAFFDNKLKNLRAGYYAFDIILGARALTVVDLLFDDSASLAEHTWKERLQRIQTFNFARCKGFMPNKIKIMDSEPTEHIDLTGLSGQLIVRDLPSFAMFTHEYVISEAEASSRYVIVGEGSLRREFRVTLKPDEYASTAKIPNGAKKALVSRLDSDEERARLAGLAEDEQLTVYNTLKDDFLAQCADGGHPPVLRYTAHNRVMLVAGKTDDGALAIFGTTKNKVADKVPRTVGLDRPPTVVWYNAACEGQFVDNTVKYFSPVLLVDCKRVHRFRGGLVNVASEGVKSYYNTADLHAGHEIYGEIDCVPEPQVSGTKSSNSLTACSYNKLCREMSARINFDYTQNPNRPETKKAVNCVSYLLNYGTFRDDCWRDADNADERRSAAAAAAKRKLNADNERVVESLSKKSRCESPDSVSAASDDCAQ